jgi:hypothetical protein
VRAPFDGMVASVTVQDRDAVAPNQPIVTPMADGCRCMRERAGGPW